MKKKTKDLFLLGTLAVLSMISLCNIFCLLLPTDSKFIVTNQKTAVYDAARIPALPTGGSLNINTADAELLDTLPGIGLVLAERIVEHRKTYGDFVHPELLTAVSGIGEKTYEKIAPHITVKEETVPAENS